MMDPGFFEGLLLGAVVAWIGGAFQFARWERRVDRDIEARYMALDRERTRRIFDKHGHKGDDAARASEWDEAR